MSLAATLTDVNSIPQTPGSALAAEGVTVSYCQGKPILEDVDVAVPEGACYAIVGPSGSGKTTLLRAFLGLLAPTAGSVSCQREGRRPTIGYIPQNLGLVRNRTVLDNVLLGAIKRIAWWRSLTGTFPATEVIEAEQALRWVGLGGRGDEAIESLSGGERRRVAIARALVQRPDILLADEFLAELDKNTAKEIEALLRSLREKTGVTIVFVEHDIETACRIADRVVVLVKGKKVAELAAAQADPARILELFQH
jgi:phosphonate transport system ATP-binding protein